ncbi:hypothetical protein ACFQ0B_21915 [Nonomuraea thailandensis]
MAWWKPSSRYRSKSAGSGPEPGREGPSSMASRPGPSLRRSTATSSASVWSASPRFATRAVSGPDRLRQPRANSASPFAIRRLRRTPGTSTRCSLGSSSASERRRAGTR